MEVREVKLINKELIINLARKACDLPRLRTNHNFHLTADDPIQRMIVVMKKGTYIRPHRHFIEKKWEFAIALTGRMQVLLFDEKGVLIGKYELSPNNELLGIEIPYEYFHTWIPLSENASFFEFKAGPYSPQFTNQFPEWAPPEGSEGVSNFLSKITSLKIGETCI